MHQALLCNHQSFTHQSPFNFTEIPLSTKFFSSITLQWKKNITQAHLSLNSQSHRTSHIVYARKNRPKTTFRISQKTAVQCAYFLASNLKIFPEPVNLILKQGLGGEGNGGGFVGGGGGGGFGGWWRRRKRKLGFLLLLGIVCGVLLLGKEFEGLRELSLGVMGMLGLVGLEKEWKKGIKGWMLGVCSVALMVFWGFRREDARKLRLRGFGVREKVLGFVRKSRRRRALW